MAIAVAARRLYRQPGFQAGIMCVVAVLCFALLVKNWQFSDDVGVRWADADEQLRVQWNRTSAIIRAAEKGRIEFLDGGQKVGLDLGRDQLRHGSVTYVRRSGGVMVRLVVERPGAPPLEEITQFLGPEPAASMASPEPPSEEQIALEIQQNRQELARQSTANDRLEQLLAETLTQLEQVTGQPQPLRSFVPPPQPPPPGPKIVDPGPPVAVRPAGLPALLPRVQTPASPAPPPAPERRPPASGRMIWVGKLQRRGVLEINADRASQGYLSGALPGVPVRVIVYPAELGADGLVLFTGDLKYAGRVSEPPGPQNGWNPTVYTWEPGQARQIAIAEPPSAANAWKRLALRNEGRTWSVIVIEWTELRGRSTQPPN